MLELQEKRRALVARAEEQRRALSRYARTLARPIILAEQGVSALRVVTASPLVVTGLSALLWRVSGRRLAKLPRIVWSAWRVFRAVRLWGG